MARCPECGSTDCTLLAFESGDYQCNSCGDCFHISESRKKYRTNNYGTGHYSSNQFGVKKEDDTLWGSLFSKIFGK